MMSPSGNAQGCTFTNQTFSGGTINVAGSCPGPAGGTRADLARGQLYGDDDGRPDRGECRGRAAGDADVGHDDRPPHRRLPVLTAA